MAQLRRLDKMAAAVADDFDPVPLGTMATITSAMCQLAKTLQEEDDT